VLCDLDGVVWLSREPIPGSVDAINRLHRMGVRVVFVTNHSAATVSEHLASLEDIGIDGVGCVPDNIVTSSLAAASLVEPRARVLVTGGDGIVEAVERRGANAVVNTGDTTFDAETFDACVVGLDRGFDYDRLNVAASAVLRGARLIGTNRDATYPTPRGLEPGGGSIVAAIATAGGVAPTFAGKPESAMAVLVRSMIDANSLDLSHDVLMVGDRRDTDGLFAERIGCAFALVESGVSPADHESLPDLAAVVDSLD
jgi:4-nitrophenyl phosphatase